MNRIVVISTLAGCWLLQVAFCSAQSIEEIRAANERQQQAYKEVWQDHPLSILIDQYFATKGKSIGQVSGNVRVVFENAPVSWAGSISFLDDKLPERGRFGFDWTQRQLRFDFYFSEGLLSSSDQFGIEPLLMWSPKAGTAFRASKGPAIAVITSPFAVERNLGNFSFFYPSIQFAFWPYLLAHLDQHGETGTLLVSEFEHNGNRTHVRFSSPYDFSLELLDVAGNLQVTHIEDQSAIIEVMNTSINSVSVPKNISVRYKENQYSFRYEFDYDEQLDKQLNWKLQVRDGTLVSSKGARYIKGGGPLRQWNIDNSVATIQNRDDVKLNEVELGKLKASNSGIGLRFWIAVAFGLAVIGAIVFRKLSQQK